MRDFEGKVAVVTGAASGMGRAFAARFAAEGMKVVLADVEEEALDLAVRELQQQERDVIGVVTNAADLSSVEALAQQTLDAFGGVHIVCNNAGVAGGGGPVWETTASDWEWVIGVNLMGVVHGIRTFVPLMLDGGEQGHIVNTSSVWGLVTRGAAPYGASKHAVTRITEGLYYDLQERTELVRCSVLCPGGIATRIGTSGRNRPDELIDDAAAAAQLLAEGVQRESERTEEGDTRMPPDEVADIVLDAIREERFYILTHPGVNSGVRTRMEDIIEQRNPSPWEPLDISGSRRPGAPASPPI